jgi:hypothetical protein
MSINAIFPIIEWAMFLAMRIFFRWIDRGFKCGENKENPTKTKSIMQYVDLYAGPEFLMHFKYSAMLNIVFVTMMYGIALPILFLYAILGLTVLWVSEKLLFFYTYRLPPSYDASLAKHVIA